MQIGILLFHVLAHTTTEGDRNTSLQYNVMVVFKIMLKSHHRMLIEVLPYFLLGQQKFLAKSELPA